MLKIFTISVLAIIALVCHTPAYAQETSSPSKEFNTFEVFWPIVAGKTRADSLYPLKKAKEKIRGWFIFTPALKADYEVYLGTKRILETEKLIAEDKDQLAIQTLSEAGANFEKAKKNKDKAKDRNSFPEKTEIQMNDRLQNLDVFLNILGKKAEADVRQKIEDVDKLVGELLLTP